ncbi:2-dehydro-3-deoxygalactonokinase [Hyphomonas sp.]|uniref:2-dehydro-3-deoxygalactonokinase n=1 Tax=Hyphomonas sp. TaxID=87 RepID=UPI0030037BA3
MTLTPSLIGVSITGNRFRAWAYDADGDVLHTCQSANLRSGPVGPGADQIRAVLDSWRRDFTGACPILVSGARDSQQGGMENHHPRVPFRLEDIGASLHRDQDVLFIPSLVQTAPPDITYGAETSLFGIEQPNGLVCMPDDLTVHFSLETGRVTGFTTELTREIHGAILARERAVSAGLPEQVFSESVFVEWVERSLDTENAVSAYAVHAAVWTRQLAPQHYECALSGLLIGADVAAHYDPGDDVILIADDINLTRYGLALDALDADVLEYSAEDCLTDGLWEIAELAGLLAD